MHVHPESSDDVHRLLTSPPGFFAQRKFQACLGTQQTHDTAKMQFRPPPGLTQDTRSEPGHKVCPSYPGLEKQRNNTGSAGYPTLLGRLGRSDALSHGPGGSVPSPRKYSMSHSQLIASRLATSKMALSERQISQPTPSESPIAHGNSVVIGSDTAPSTCKELTSIASALGETGLGSSPTTLTGLVSAAANESVRQCDGLDWNQDEPLKVSPLSSCFQAMLPSASGGAANISPPYLSPGAPQSPIDMLQEVQRGAHACNHDARTQLAAPCNNVCEHMHEGSKGLDFASNGNPGLQRIPASKCFQSKNSQLELATLSAIQFLSNVNVGTVGSGLRLPYGRATPHPALRFSACNPHEHSAPIEFSHLSTIAGTMPQSIYSLQGMAVTCVGESTEPHDISTERLLQVPGVARERCGPTTMSLEHALGLPNVHAARADGNDVNLQACKTQGWHTDAGGCGCLPEAKQGKRLTCKFIFSNIDLARDADFELVPRLIGRGGNHMRAIADACNGKVRIRGRGSGFQEPRRGGKKGRKSDLAEAGVPLQIALSCLDSEGFEEGKERITLLLQALSSHFERYCRKKNVDPPVPFFTIVG